MRASLGPTLRYIRAMTIMTIKITRTSSPAPTTTSVGNPNMTTSLSFHPSGLFASYCSRRKSLLGEFFPLPDVGNALFIPLDDHFGALLDGFAVVAASARAATRST